jgi:uncharacterized oligopeptide transporter (OPT) family protein
MRKIKILFYILFVLDVLAGFVVAALASLQAGIVTASVLLILNITVYAIIIKAYKAGNDGAK